MTIYPSVPLNDKNWFKTGGSARYFATPRTAEEFQQALTFATQKKLRIFLLGHGSNILMCDGEINALVIQPHLTSISANIRKQTLTAGAGTNLAVVLTQALEHKLLGFEEFAGIPGTVGGATYINIHYFQHALSDLLLSGTVIHRTTGEITTVSKKWFAFDYDYSTLKNKDYFLLDATFQLKKESDLEIAYARGRIAEIIRHRMQRYPTKRSCGSFFRNFKKEELSRRAPLPYIAYYLDALGLKGHLRRGKAMISYKHANMIVTEPGATSADVIAVARNMQERVWQTYGIVPVPECQFIGFDEFPLYTPNDIQSI